MKKLTISLLALAAMSTASFATFRDITTPRGAVDDQRTGALMATELSAIPDAADGNAGDDLELGGSNRS